MWKTRIPAQISEDLPESKHWFEISFNSILCWSFTISSICLSFSPQIALFLSWLKSKCPLHVMLLVHIHVDEWYKWMLFWFFKFHLLWLIHGNLWNLFSRIKSFSIKSITILLKHSKSSRNAWLLYRYHMVDTYLFAVALCKHDAIQHDISINDSD